MSGKHDRAAELRAIAEGRLMLNVRNGVTVSRSMLAMIADELDAERAAHAETKRERDRLANTLALHRGDILSLNNEVETFRDHWNDSEVQLKNATAQRDEALKALEQRDADIAELAAENERMKHCSFLARVAAYFDASDLASSFMSEDGDGGFLAAIHRMTQEIASLRAEALSRPVAVKVPAEASKEMIEDGVLAYDLTGIDGGFINTAEDHVTFIWNAMAAHLSDLEPAAPEGQQPVAKAVELSGNTGELIEKMAEAIRGDTTSDDTPWATLSEDRKIGWRGDAERALAVVKEYLTARSPSEQAVTEAMVEAVQRIRKTAMRQSVIARIPECGEFAGIAQDADWLLDALEAAMEAGG